MAKVISPLMSMEASGKLGDALVYFRIGGDNIVRQYTTPTNPQTLVQMAHRSIFGAAAKGAKAITNPATIATIPGSGGYSYRWRQNVIKYAVTNWDEKVREFDTFNAPDQEDWENAATGLGIQPYVLGGNTYSPGQIFFATASGLHLLVPGLEASPVADNSAQWVAVFAA